MKYKVFSIILFLLLGMVLTGCQEEQAAIEYAGLKVKTYTVTQQSLAETEKFFGEVISKEAVTISSSVPGRIHVTSQKNGDYVNQGQILFQIQNTDIESSESQANSAVKVAQANLEKVKAGPTDQEVLAVEETVNGAKAAVDAANQQVKRLEILFDSGAISKQQLEQAQTEQKLAESKFNSLIHQLDQMKSGPSKETIEVAHTQVQQAKSAYETASTKVAELSIESPISGYISNLKVQEGEFINPGLPLATIHNIEQVYVQMHIPESIYLKLKLGEEVKVTIPTINKTYPGTLEELDPQADPRTKLFTVKALLHNEDSLLKPGMATEIDFSQSERKEVITVPLDAVMNDKGQNVVYILEENIARKRMIQTGIRTNTEVEIVSGLKKGDNIIREGIEFVRDGDKVHVLKEGSE